MRDCIRCAKCINVCPMGLAPNLLMNLTLSVPDDYFASFTDKLMAQIPAVKEENTVVVVLC